MKTQTLVQDDKTKELLAKIIQEIIRITDPEAILLLSAIYEYRFTENIFKKGPLFESWGKGYELLVLMDRNKDKSWAEQETIIRSRLPHFHNLRLQQNSIQDFNTKVESGEEYENFILLNAMISYHKGQIRLAFPDRLVYG